MFKMNYLVSGVCLLICALHNEVFCQGQPPQPGPFFQNSGDGIGGSPVNPPPSPPPSPSPSPPPDNQRTNKAYPDPKDRNPTTPKPCFGRNCPENNDRYRDLPPNPWLPKNRPSPTKPKSTCKHGDYDMYSRSHHHHHKHHHHDSYYDHSGDSYGYPNDDFHSPDCETRENERNMEDCYNKDCSECNGYGCIFSL